MADRSIIAVGGENLIDHVSRDDVVSACPGGSPFNVAMALGRQSADVCYISPISNDVWGDMLAATLVEAGVCLTGGRNTAPTTMARVAVSNGIPSYSFERERTAERMVSAQSLSDALPKAAVSVHTGSLTLTDGADASAWEAFCSTCYADGRFVSLDPNVRLSVVSNVEGFRDRILRMCQRLHLLKLSDEDLDDLFPDLAPEQAIDRLREITSAPVVVLTRGAGGVSAWTRTGKVDMPATAVPRLVDTVGAGDTFMATLLAALADRNALSAAALAPVTRDDLTMLLFRACTAAALNCRHAGCNPPSSDEIDAAVARKV